MITKSVRPLGRIGSLVRRMRSSENPSTSAAGTYWLKASGRPSAEAHRQQESLVPGIEDTAEVIE
jgi:hypothetical protein